MTSASPTRVEVQIHRDIQYTVARIAYNDGAGPMIDRALCLDWYQPLGATGPRPALVLAFGGAFHRVPLPAVFRKTR